MFGALRVISGDGARDFSEHPLRLRPCSESLRSRLVRHDGRKGLTVQVDAPPAAASASSMCSPRSAGGVPEDDDVPIRHHLRSREQASDIPVVRTSLVELLARALDTEDATDLPVLGPLDAQLEDWEKPKPPGMPPRGNGLRGRRG